MSIPFNDTSTYKGLVQVYEKEAGFNRGDISGDTDKLKEFATDVNLAFDDFTVIALRSTGLWDWDDSNQTDYPIITTNLVSGQRDYSFTTDGSGNIILEVKRVAILPSATATLYQEIEPMDAQSDRFNALTANNTATGVPYQYDKTANGIFLDPIPGYNATNGLKLYISREASYFAHTDTTKKPGVPGVFHRYFAIKPAMEYARRNSLSSFAGLYKEVLAFEGDEEQGIEGSIARYFARRDKDTRKVMKGKKVLYI